MTATTFPTRTDRTIALASGLLAIAMAATSLAGWFTGTEILKTVWPGGALMMPNTAFGLTASGLSVILSVIRRRSALQSAIGLAVSAFGLMFLLEYWLHADFGVDNFHFARSLAEFCPDDLLSPPRRVSSRSVSRLR